MFIVKAEFDEQMEIRAGFDKVREFFSNTANLVEFIPSVESIRPVSGNTATWTLGVEFPMIGKFRQEFLAEEADSASDLIDWHPQNNETTNFLKYSVDLLSKGEDSTLIRLRHLLELRRESASQLHSMAGFAGAGFISREMEKQVTKNIQAFLAEAKKRLEN